MNELRFDPSLPTAVLSATAHPIKVAHITTIDASLRYLLLNQLIYIQADGYEVIGISAPGEDVPFIEAEGIRHMPISITRRFTPVQDGRSLWQLYQLLRRERFTIVHTHTPKPSLLGQLAAKLAGVPIIVNTIHGFYFHDSMKPAIRRFYILLEKIAATCSDAILSQNQEDMHTAVAHAIAPPQKISHLGNGIDIQRFNRATLSPQRIRQTQQALDISPDTPVVGFVGRLVKEKGLLDLLSAMQQVVRQMPHVKLLVVGPTDSEKEDALSPTIAADYGLGAHCIFTGMRQDMPELYALMDLFVLPSYREGFPRSPMEASAMGVPCIVTDIRGCREAVIHGRNGLLVPLGQPDALAAAILQLLTDKKQAQQLGQNGRRLAEQQFDEQQIFQTVTNTYAHLLKTKAIAS